MDFIKKIDLEIDRKLEEMKAFPNLYLMILYHMKERGSRIIVKIAGDICEALELDSNKIIKPAAWFELFHNFTLIHDDIIDQDDTRRGQDSVWKKWDVNKAILAGDAMLALVTLSLDAFKDFDLEQEILEFILTVMEGEFYDILYEEKDEVSLEACINMLKMKSGRTISFLLQIIGTLSGVNQEVMSELVCLGEKIGLCLQIKNDIMNILDGFPQNDSGDIRRKKKTLPIVYCLKHADYDAVEKYRKASEYKTGNAAQWIIRNHGIQYAIKQAIAYKEEAAVIIEGLGENVISNMNKEILKDKISHDFYLSPDTLEELLVNSAIYVD